VHSDVARPINLRGKQRGPRIIHHVSGRAQHNQSFLGPVRSIARQFLSQSLVPRKNRASAWRFGSPGPYASSRTHNDGAVIVLFVRKALGPQEGGMLSFDSLACTPGAGRGPNRTEAALSTPTRAPISNAERDQLRLRSRFRLGLACAAWVMERFDVLKAAGARLARME